jgi:hypothetical protein
MTNEQRNELIIILKTLIDKFINFTGDKDRTSVFEALQEALNTACDEHQTLEGEWE